MFPNEALSESYTLCLICTPQQAHVSYTHEVYRSYIVCIYVFILQDLEDEEGKEKSNITR